MTQHMENWILNPYKIRELQGAHMPDLESDNGDEDEEESNHSPANSNDADDEYEDSNVVSYDRKTDTDMVETSAEGMVRNFPTRLNKHIFFALISPSSSVPITQS